MDEEDSKLKINKAEQVISQRIFSIRECRVMIDADLAELYGVSTKVFNQAVKRNIDRFPSDFMFQISAEEKDYLVTNCDHPRKLKFSYNMPYAFTEHGVAMLSAILNSKQAILMSIFIVRAFIKMRESLDNYKDLALKMGELESNQIKDHAILNEVYAALQHLISSPIKPKGKLGFNESQ